MKVIFIYKDKNDLELFKLVPLDITVYTEIINSEKDKSEAYSIKNKYGARKDPFILIEDNEGRFVNCFWTENGNAVQQLIKWINYEDKDSFIKTK